MEYKDFPKLYSPFIRRETDKEWFKNLHSLFSMRMGKKDILTEGLVFYHPDGRICKLRRDMFIEFWDGTWDTPIEELRKHRNVKEEI